MKVFLIATGIFLLIMILPVSCALYSVYSSAVTAPSRVINKTLQTNNIIMNYELFHDENQNFKARVAQIDEHEKFLGSETDPEERTRLRMEMAAEQQSCRELVADYNANSSKLNRSVFRDRNLPYMLNPQSCEIQG